MTTKTSVMSVVSSQDKVHLFSRVLFHRATIFTSVSPQYERTSIGVMFFRILSRTGVSVSRGSEVRRANLTQSAFPDSVSTATVSSRTEEPPATVRPTTQVSNPLWNCPH